MAEAVEGLGEEAAKQVREEVRGELVGLVRGVISMLEATMRRRKRWGSSGGIRREVGLGASSTCSWITF